MAAGSRIAVEVAGNAASLQEAVDKAAASLRGLADTVAKTSTATIASGDRIIASNEALAKSYAGTAGAAEASSARSVSAAKKTEVAFGSAHSSITKLGKDVTLALAGVAAGAVYSGVKFQDATTSIAKNAGITTQAAAKIGDAFLTTAGHSIFSATTMSNAFGQVAGQLKLTEGHALSTGDALKVMKVSSDLAEASGQSLSSTTQALANVMQSYHLNVGQAASASDVLFNISKSLNVPIDSVAGGIDKLHGRLGILIPSMTDLGALMTAVASTGITGSRSIMIVQSSLSTLVGGSKATTDMLTQLGLKTSDLYGPHGFLGMTNAIEVLRPKLAELTSTSQKAALIALFGKTNWQLMGQIIEAGVPKFQAGTAAIGQMGTAHAAAAQQGKTLSDQWKLLVATLEDYAIKISGVLIPALTAMVRWVTNAVGWLQKHKQAAAELAGVVGGVLSLAIASFAYSKVKAFVNGVQDMYNGVKTLASFLKDTLSPQLLATGDDSATMAGKMDAASTGGVAKLGGASKATAGEVTAVTGAEETNVTESAGIVTAMDAEAGGVAGIGAAAKTSLISMAPFLGALGGIAAMGGLFGKNAAGQGGTASGSIFSSNAEASAFYNSAAGSKFYGTTAALQAAQAAFNVQWLKTHPNAAAAVTAGGGIVGGYNQGMVMPSSFSSSANWAKTLLAAMGVKASSGAVTALEDFQAHEGPFGTQAQYNPLNVSGPLAGTGKFDGTPAENYGSAAAGIAGELAYFQRYGPGVIAALRTGNVASVEAAVRALGPNAFGNDTATPWAGSTAGGGGSSFPTGTGTVTSSTAPKPPATSFHYDWRTGKYQLMTAAQYKQLQDEWYAQNSGRPMPTSPAKATATSQAAAAYAITGNTLPGLDTALTRISTAQTKAGDTMLGGLTGAVQSGSLSSLNSQLNYTHTQAMNKLVVGLLEVHTKANEKLALQIDSEYQKALKEQNTLVAAAQEKAAQAALGKAVTATASAFDKQSTTLGKLYGAGISLGLPGQTAITGGLAQEVPLTGSLTGTALAPVLAQLIPQLEGGPLSQSQLTQYAGAFGHNSELGTLFGGLASGNLNATDTASSYDTIYTLIGSLATLQTTIGDNTNALANNTATMVSLLQQQNTILSEKVALGAAQGSVLRNYIPNLPHYASGGPVIDDGLIYAHAGEHVVPQGGSLVMSGGAQSPIHLHQTVSGNMAPLLSLIDERVSHPDNVLKISRQIGTRTGQLRGAPGGWR